MEGVALSDLIPHYEATDSSGATSEAMPAVMLDDFYYPQDHHCGGGITTIMTFDLDSPSANFKSASIVADANIVYASTNALYILIAIGKDALNDNGEPGPKRCMITRRLSSGRRITFWRFPLIYT
jgi:hypothetical protein